jgi:hypothetical protein
MLHAVFVEKSAGRIEIGNGPFRPCGSGVHAQSPGENRVRLSSLIPGRLSTTPQRPMVAATAAQP